MATRDTLDPVAAAAPAATVRLAEPELCRLTLAGPARRVDVALPVSTTLGELLGLLLRRLVEGADRDGSWVLQRLGGPALDPGESAESLGLQHGEVLYLSRARSVLPELEFDDISVGVAQTVVGRGDLWRPAHARPLLLGLAPAVLAACAASVLGLGLGPGPVARPALSLGCGALVLVLGAVLAARVFGDRAAGLTAGLSGCAFAALAGLAARHGVSGVFAPDRFDVLIAGLCTALPGSALPLAGRFPPAPFGTAAGAGAAAAAGSVLALWLHWPAATAAMVLAVAVFLLITIDVRYVLRLARLRVPQLPHSAEELQQDIEPEPASSVTRRTGAAVAYLTILVNTAALVFLVAFTYLARSPQWLCVALAVVLSVAVLLRARMFTVLWQRVPLTICGAAGLAMVLYFRAAHGSPAAHEAGLGVLFLVAAVLFALARRRPARRLLPIWGHLADLLELWTAVAIVPVTMQILHIFAHLRALIR